MNRLSFLIILISVLWVACTPATMMEKTWVEPSVKEKGFKPFTKALVIGMLKDESTRRIAEDRLAKATKFTAVPSYNYITRADTSQEKFEAKLKADGFDGIIMMRLVDTEYSTSYVPGANAYGGWYGYYGYAYPGYYSPGYYTTDKIYFVETMVYSLNPDKLLYSGITSTVNPARGEQMVDDIILVVKDNMKRQKLIK